MRKLFGGAIVADIPTNSIDVSNFRQVPDNQEVFLHRDSDVSIIIEVLQPAPESSDIEAVKFHFQALAHDNDAISSTMQTPNALHNVRGDQPTPIILHGSQRIRKFNESTGTEDDVDILIALFRVRSGGKSADLVVSESIPRGSKYGGGKERAAAEFSALVSSLRIIDYGLFC